VRSALTEIVAVPATEVQRLVEAAEDDRYRLAILLASEVGLRVGEIRGLRWGEREGRTDHRATRDRHSRQRADPEHDRRRSIPLSAALSRALADPARRGLHVVPRLDGGVLGCCAMREAIHDVYDAAEVEAPEMPWHCVRHTFGTELATRGVPLPVIRDLMGHADVKTTMR
jgi:integrase